MAEPRDPSTPTNPPERPELERYAEHCEQRIKADTHIRVDLYLREVIRYALELEQRVRDLEAQIAGAPTVYCVSCGKTGHRCEGC